MTDRLVWIDCEMTGLELGSDKLIEVAALVTDSDLNVLGKGIDVVIHVGDDVLDGMVEVVREMHARSGLTEAVRASTVSLAEAEERVLEYITKYVPEPKSAPLCGNSIATDHRGFIARDMPALDTHLHYRMVDVSSIKELCRLVPRVYFGQPAKVFRTAPWRTSARASASWRTTAARCSCRCPVPMWTPPRLSRRS